MNGNLAQIHKLLKYTPDKKCAKYWCDIDTLPRQGDASRSDLLKLSSAAYANGNNYILTTPIEIPAVNKILDRYCLLALNI